MRQQKQVRECPKCSAAMKKTIGAVSRKKWWACTDEGCGYRRPVLHSD